MIQNVGFPIGWRALVLEGLSLSVLALVGCNSPIKSGGDARLDGATQPDVALGADAGFAPDGGASQPDTVPGADVGFTADGASQSDTTPGVGVGSAPDGSSQPDMVAVMDVGLALDGATQTTELIQLVDADGAFNVSASGIQRTGKELSQSSNRHYMKSFRADYIVGDWTCQVTFHSSANAPDDIIFIGLGEAVPDSSSFNEPRNSVNFRIHQGATSFGNGWDVDVVAHDIGYLHWTYSNLGVGALPGAAGGTHTVQITKKGAQITFAILDAGIVVTIPDLAVAAPFLYTGASRIFFGNASSAYSFDPPVLLLRP